MWRSGGVIAYGRRVRMLSGLSPRSAVLDVGIGVVALALSLGFGRHAALSQPGTRPLDALGYALVVMSCAAVVARRVAPVPVLGIVVAAFVLFAAFNYPGGPLLVPVIVAVYSVGAACCSGAGCGGDGHRGGPGMAVGDAGPGVGVHLGGAGLGARLAGVGGGGAVAAAVAGVGPAAC